MNFNTGLYVTKPNQQQRIFSMGKCDPFQLQNVNVDKTKCMVFKPKSYIITDPIFTLYK